MKLFEPQIRPVREVDLQSLHEAAQADDHAVLWPTHVVKKNDEFVGYLSIGAVPTVLLWMHKNKTTVRDSHAVATFFENFVAQASGVLVPVPKDSPFHPLMSHAGYHNVAEGTMFMKRI